MKEEGINERSSIVVPVLLGSIVGAGIALMLTPKSGSDMRSDLKQFATRTRNKLYESAETGKDMYEEGASASASASEAAKQLYAEGSESIEELSGAEETKKASFLVPVLVSGIIGAGIALLFAPKPGSELRGDMKRMAGSAADSIGSAIEKGKSAYQEAAASAKQAAEKAYAEGKEKLKQAA